MQKDKKKMDIRKGKEVEIASQFNNNSLKYLGKVSYYNAHGNMQNNLERKYINM